MALLRKRPKPPKEGYVDKTEGKVKGRQKFLDFFRSRRRKSQASDTDTLPTQILSPKPTGDSKPAPSPLRIDSNAATIEPPVGKGESNQEQAQLPTPLTELKEPKLVTLSEDNVHSFFYGAPQFSVEDIQGRLEPKASYPWDSEPLARNVTDSLPLAHPAFSTATLRQHVPVVKEDTQEKERTYVGYDIGIAEVPSMLSAQGLEPGTVGFDYFLQLPISDNLATRMEDSESSNGLSEAVRNMELMQNNPERLGIRNVDIVMIHERLIEFGDLWETFSEGTGKVTILDKPAPGELYANLFGKFLTPPRFDPDAVDPTGLKVQIETLLKILRLKGIWYDFSLIEWRIRLGQILWTVADPAAGDETPGVSDQDQTWTERNLLLLQISLACELLLRLDAVSGMAETEVTSDAHLMAGDFKNFTNLGTRKTNWDLILARRFLENIQVKALPERPPPPPSPKVRGFLASVLTKPEQLNVPHTQKPDVVLLPRHQSQQLSGLLYFAESLTWPNIDIIAAELAQKLNISNSQQAPESPSAGFSRYLDPTTPTSPSIYGTPLATPRTATSTRNSYFGSINKRPRLNRNGTQRSLQLRPSSLLGNDANGPADDLDIGGWLSHIYLTGLILPGEAISHFLISTLLENDKLAIAALGDSANLYGGFIYGERSWWSKSCVVGRVLAALDGAVECMGWISIPKLPSGCVDGWMEIESEQVSLEEKPRIVDEDAVSKYSSPIPTGDFENVRPEDLTLPLDPSLPPLPFIQLLEWSLTHESSASSVPENEDRFDEEDEGAYTATLTFSHHSTSETPVEYTISLRYDIQVISSFPCTIPSANIRFLSRTASKRLIFKRRYSHGFEPLLSHPPDSAASTPVRTQIPETTEFPFQAQAQSPLQPGQPLPAHPLHVSYKYKIVGVAEVLGVAFEIPEAETVLVLDARGERDLELLARAWCAERGLHAIIGRAGRTCLGCCVREARGLGVKVVVRV
ncbi:hypothetical protein K432DRAFT_432055 [Lepidopterella palustris CBS 459.81]|uniref:Uncharacterized protein n=1 Tax=Lepidopterella palustris CBS 459.81 TaxID=1314670 RepID=A0A8E2JJB4_9PEZI|nr:hypothetical protein K432DRAFT_432055 [Lepidopterella palustris CBS 459.81]